MMKKVKSASTWLTVLIVLTTIGLLSRIYSYVTTYFKQKDYGNLPGIDSHQVDLIKQLDNLSQSPIVKIVSTLLIIIALVALVLIVKDRIGLGKLNVPTLTGMTIYLTYHVLDIIFILYGLYMSKNLTFQIYGNELIKSIYIGVFITTILPCVLMIILSVVTLLKLSNLNQQELDAQDYSDL